MTMELGGRVTIECKQNNFQAELEFKLKVGLAAPPPASPTAMVGVGLGLVQREASGIPLLPSLCSRDGFLSKCARGSSSRHPYGTAGAQRGQGAG